MLSRHVPEVVCSTCQAQHATYLLQYLCCATAFVALLLLREGPWHQNCLPVAEDRQLFSTFQE